MLTFHKTYQYLEKRSHIGTREGLQLYVFLTSVYSLLHRQVKLYTFWKDDLNCLINSSLNTPEVQLPSSGDYNKTDINLEQCSIYSRLHIFILDFSPCFDDKSCNVTGLERDIGSQVALWADITCWVTVGQCHPSAVDMMEASLPKQTVNPAMRISFLGQFVQFDQNAAGGGTFWLKERPGLKQFHQSGFYRSSSDPAWAEDCFRGFSFLARCFVKKHSIFKFV